MLYDTTKKEECTEGKRKGGLERSKSGRREAIR
jgi:ligand-binding sensor protein